MTVKELREKLESFPDNCIVMIPYTETTHVTMLENVSRGINEHDGLVFLDDYIERD